MNDENPLPVFLAPDLAAVAPRRACSPARRNVEKRRARNRVAEGKEEEEEEGMEEEAVLKSAV